MMRFDGHKYRDCRWCHGCGCLYCKAGADKAYKQAFPDGPKPFATFTLDEMPIAQQALGPDAIKKAFAPGGGGIEEIAENVRKLKSGNQ